MTVKHEPSAAQRKPRAKKLPQPATTPLPPIKPRGGWDVIGCSSFRVVEGFDRLVYALERIAAALEKAA
jgi:hypothetical protein